MREVLSSDLLLRLIHATPEQYAHVERVLGMSGSDGWTPPDSATDDDARKLFALLKALESEGNYQKAPVTRVFQLYCLESKTRKEVAKACRCAPSLITLRLKTIEKKLGRKPAELRSISPEFERIADSLSDSPARRIRRESALGGEDPEDED